MFDLTLTFDNGPDPETSPLRRLRGRDREGDENRYSRPLPLLPRKRGREQIEFTARADSIRRTGLLFISPRW